jgi:predicted ATPase
MKNKRIVITGCPGAGKTSIIKGLEDKGYSVFEEYSRTLIDEGKATGKANFFLSNPEEFSELLFSGRKAQFKAFSSLYVHAAKPYLLAVKGRDDFWEKRIIPFKYDLVFLVEPWKEIYKKDTQRMETFIEAKRYFPYIKNLYKQSHLIVTVPKDTIINRVLFIEHYIKLHG